MKDTDTGFYWEIIPEADTGFQLHISEAVAYEDGAVISRWFATKENLITALKRVVARLEGD